MRQLQLTGNLDKLNKMLTEGHSDWWLFNNFRHDFTNYNELVREYNSTNSYMKLVNQFVVLCGKHLPTSYKKLTRDFYNKKLSMNS